MIRQILVNLLIVCADQCVRVNRGTLFQNGGAGWVGESIYRKTIRGTPLEHLQYLAKLSVRHQKITAAW